jgi:hypothetical protein
VFSALSHHRHFQSELQALAPVLSGVLFLSQRTYGILVLRIANRYPFYDPGVITYTAAEMGEGHASTEESVVCSGQPTKDA